MLRFLFVIPLVVLLSGCIHSEQKIIPKTAGLSFADDPVLKEGFRLRDKDNKLVFLRAGSGNYLELFNFKDDKWSKSVNLNIAYMPEAPYVILEIVNASKDAPYPFEYYALLRTRNGFTVGHADVRQKVTDWDDLQKTMAKVYREKKYTTVKAYRFDDPKLASTWPLFKNFAFAKENSKTASSTSQTIASQSKARQTTTSHNSRSTRIAKTDGRFADMDVGDVYYLSGVLNDVPAQIIRIDRQNKRLKIRRGDDGTTEWVSPSRLVSRAQATTNDLVRGGVVIGAFVCILSPDTCSK